MTQRDIIQAANKEMTKLNIKSVSRNGVKGNQGKNLSDPVTVTGSLHADAIESREDLRRRIKTMI